MAVDPRKYISVDKRMPATLAGDAGKALTVSDDELSYEHADSGVGVPIPGQVIIWLFDTPPAGFLMIDGATHNYDDYPVLGALFGAGPGEQFTLPAPTFLKNSFGVNTNTVEPEGVGTHGHSTSLPAAHDHPVTVVSASSHSHSASVQGSGSHSHTTDASRISRSTNASSGSARSSVTSLTSSVVSGTGSHTHTATVTSGGAHGHSASTTAVVAPAPAITNHVGTNQPECLLVNLCIRT